MLCYNCFQEFTGDSCPYCGFDLRANEEKFPVALRAGTTLNNRYTVGRVLGQGGFGITYLARDEKLGSRVAIKEYMPNELATRLGTTVSVAVGSRSEDFTFGLDSFTQEARTLAKFVGNPNIAGVSDFFDENNTSYFVMDYIEGMSFKTYIANQGGKVSVDDALNVMIPVLRALSAVHAEGFIHRDVTPDNIFISKDGNIKLLDFGSARYSIGDKSKSLDVILKVGYAPKEQYIRRGRQGPYTDVYSCAACLYASLTGYLPPESLERLDEDPLIPVSQCGVAIPEYLDKAILKGLAVNAEDRFQTAQEFLSALEMQQVVEVPVRTAAVVEAPPAKKKAPIAAILAAAVAVLAVVVGFLVFGDRGGSVTDPDKVVSGGQQSGGNNGGNNGGSNNGGSNNGGGSGGGQQGGNGGGSKDDGVYIEPEVPSITIQGTEYSTDLTELSLPQMGLTNEDIQDLKYMVNLRYIDLSGNDITDLSPLSGLTQLTSVILGSNRELEDFTPLTSCKKLTRVMLHGTAIQDYSFLAELPEITELQLYQTTSDMDLSCLQGLTNVTNVEFTGGQNHLNDLSFLQNMTKLTRIYFQGYLENWDLTPLQNLTELEELSLDDKRNTVIEVDLTPLKGLTRLYDLRLCGNLHYDNFDPIAGLTKLQQLRLSGGSCLLPDFSAFTNLTKLNSIILSVEGVESFRGLENLKELTSLIFEGGGSTPSRLTDLEPLRELTKLRELDLPSSDYDSTNFCDLSALSGLTNLASLYINCRVKDLAPLAGLTGLKELHINEYCNDNIPPLDLTPLSGLTDVTVLSFASNRAARVCDITPLSGMTGLRELYLSIYANYEDRITDLSPLASLTKLTSLTIYGCAEGIDTSPVSFVSELKIH